MFGKKRSKNKSLHFFSLCYMERRTGYVRRKLKTVKIENQLKKKGGGPDCIWTECNSEFQWERNLLRAVSHMERMKED